MLLEHIGDARALCAQERPFRNVEEASSILAKREVGARLARAECSANRVGGLGAVGVEVELGPVAPRVPRQERCALKRDAPQKGRACGIEELLEDPEHR